MNTLKTVHGPTRPRPSPAASGSPSWNLLQSFLAVLDAGSLLAAARQLGTTQPTVGRHIEALEAQLGLLLFDRTARGLVPTAHAHRIAKPARQMQHSALELCGIVVGQQSGTDLATTVRISASEMVSLHVLPGLLRKLAVSAPDIRLAVVASDSVVNLLRRDADIAIRMVRPEQQSVIARRIGQMPLLPCAAQSHIDRWGMPRSMAELLRQPMILPDRDPAFGQFLRKAGITRDAFNIALLTDSIPLSWQAISQGLGVGVAARHMIERTAHVHRVPVELHVPPLPVWLAVHRELRTSQAIRRVFDFLADELKLITGPT